MEEKQINDKIHRLLVNEMVSFINRRNSKKDDFQIEIEKPYNFYGSRGFIDIYFSYCLENGIYEIEYRALMHVICEIKPFIINFGESIRQLKKPVTAVFNRSSDKYNLQLICLNTFENLNLLRENWCSLASIDSNLIISIVDLEKLRELNKKKERKSDSVIVAINTSKMNESNFGYYESLIKEKMKLISNKEVMQKYKWNIL